jgi:transcription elongation factor S-II
MLTTTQSTKAGQIIAKQRSNPSKTVAKLASEIVGKWRKAVEDEKRRKAASGSGTPRPASTDSPAPGGTDSPAPKTDSSKYQGDIATRKWNTDGVDVKRTGSATRDNCVGLLYNGLAFMSHESPTAVIIRAMEVEKAAYSIFKGETSDYKAKMRSLFQNLKNKNNKELGPKVMSGAIKPERFVVMTHEELKSAEMKKTEEEMEKENLKKAQVPMAQRSISDALTCGKCKEKKVAYSQAQTRSADEPMTTFCECTVCGNRWKVCCCSSFPMLWLCTNYLSSSLEAAARPMASTYYVWLSRHQLTSLSNSGCPHKQSAARISPFIAPFPR